MAISPPSDIVLDVIRAADPASARAAATSLARTGSVRSLNTPEFSQVMGDVARLPSPVLPFDPDAALTGMRNTAALSSHGRAAAEPFQRFEAFVLQTFIQSMLPDNSAAVFGAGQSGEIWKSMLAEQIAAQLAAAGGIGIAEQVGGAHAPRAGLSG